MITYEVSAYDKDNATFKFKGLSTDTKPKVMFNDMGISGESTFFEKDTQEVFFYDTDDWLPQP